MNNYLELIKGDITQLQVDAIVNAANKSLLGGGGVDGAIHDAAGPALLEECEKLNGCATGDAKITKGYLLPAKYVIHTVGPIWHGGDKGEVDSLASCYRKCLEIAVANKIKSIAFPNISTGVYRFPKGLAADTALWEIQKFMKQNKTIEKIIFAVFDDENYELYRNKMKDLI